MLISRITVRHANLLWGYLLNQNPFEENLNNRAYPVRTMSQVGKELERFERQAVLDYLWIQSIPMLSLGMIRMILSHIVVLFRLEKRSIRSATYEKEFAERCEKGTKKDIALDVKMFKQSIVGTGANACGEFAQYFDGTNYEASVLSLIDLTERVLIGLDDFLPIVTVFSSARAADAKNSLQYESGSGAE